MKPYTEEMLLFLSEPDSKYYAQLLLPEIAAVLGVTVSQLESKPIDVQLILAQTYVNCWHSDNANIREILEQDILLQDEPKENEKQVQREEPAEKKTHFRNMEMERIR